MPRGRALATWPHPGLHSRRPPSAAPQLIRLHSPWPQHLPAAEVGQPGSAGWRPPGGLVFGPVRLEWHASPAAAAAVLAGLCFPGGEAGSAWASSGAERVPIRRPVSPPGAAVFSWGGGPVGCGGRGRQWGCRAGGQLVGGPQEEMGGAASVATGPLPEQWGLGLGRRSWGGSGCCRWAGSGMGCGEAPSDHLALQ